MHDRSFRLGWAESRLPGGVGCDLTGFLARENPSIGEREPLFARALWLSDGFAAFALVSVDVLAVPPALVARVRRRLKDERHCAPRWLCVCATHTHSAPATIFLANCGLADRAWNLALENTLVDLVVEAEATASRRVLLRFAAADAPGYSYNRRTRRAEGAPEKDALRRGPPDTTLRVLTALDARTEKPLAALVHFACHPVFHGDRLIGPDWPGQMLRTIRKRMGGGFLPMFVQGACGDVNPQTPLPSPEDNAARMGNGLADKALECIADGGRGNRLSPYIAGGSARVRLPWRSVPDEQHLAEYALSPSEWAAADKDAQAKHLWANRILRARRRGWWRAGLAMPVQVLTIGELCVAAFGAEVFTRTALDVMAARTGRPTLVAGYANADVGYLPPEVEYQYGGYEIERAYRYYGYPGAFSPDAERLARERKGMRVDGKVRHMIAVKRRRARSGR